MGVYLLLASDVICLNMAGIPMVVLNSKDAVHDLLDKRSAIYSDRSDNFKQADQGGASSLSSGVDRDMSC